MADSALSGASGTMSVALAAMAGSMVTRASAWSLQTARYSASNVSVPTVVSCDVPCGAAGHPVAEEPDLRLRDAFMVFECGLFRHLTIADGSKEQRQDLGLDQLGGHELMRRVDFDVAGNEVQQGRGIDHVAGHPCTVQGHIDVIGTRRGTRSSRGA